MDRSPRERRGRARTAALLGALAAAAALVALVLWAGARDAARRDDGGSPAERALADAARPHEALRDADALAAEDAPSERAPVDLPAVLPDGEVEGRVVLLDGAGRERIPPPGELALNYEARGSVTGFSVLHADGRFRFAGRPGLLISAEPAELDGRIAFLVGAPQRIVPADGPLVLRYQEAPELALEVVDARSGRELGGIAVVAGCLDPRHPNAPTLATNADSPIALALEEPDELWVGAEGFAWRRVEVDPRGGGVVRVELDVGGRLHVLVDESQTRRHARVAVGPLSRPELSAAVVDGVRGEARIDGLPRGDYVVRLEGGGWDSTIYDWGVVHVEPGRLATLELAHTPHPRTSSLFHVQGLLAVPLRLDVSDLRLEIATASTGYRTVAATIERADMVPRSEGLAFDAWLTPGRYGWSIDSLGVRGEFVVTTDDAQRVTLEVPPVAPVTVEIVGVQPIDTADAYLTWTSPAAARPLGRYWFFQDLPGGRASFLAPVGPLELEVVTETHPELVLHVDVRPGGTHVPVTLPAAHGLRLFAWDTQSGAQLDPYVDVIPLGHGGRVTGFGDPSADEFEWIFVDRPGRYRVQPDAGWGYAPLAPIEVEVAAGKMVRVDLSLDPVEMQSP